MQAATSLTEKIQQRIANQNGNNGHSVPAARTEPVKKPRRTAGSQVAPLTRSAPPLNENNGHQGNGMNELSPASQISKEDRAARDLPNGRHLSSVPTSFESLLTMDGEQRNAHQILGVLVEADVREAEAIMGRTILPATEDAVTVSDCLDIATAGLMPGRPWSRPLPQLSSWTLRILRSLPSVRGESRRQFVDAWNSSEKRRLEMAADEQRRRLQGA